MTKLMHVYAFILQKKNRPIRTVPTSIQKTQGHEYNIYSPKIDYSEK